MSRVQEIQEALLQGEDPGLAVVETLGDIAALPETTDAVYVIDLSDEKIRALTRLRALVWVGHGGESRVSDAGIAQLVGLDALEMLDLEGAAEITDHALDTLASLPALVWLDVGACPLLSEAALDELARVKPALQILR